MKGQAQCHGDATAKAPGKLVKRGNGGHVSATVPSAVLDLCFSLLQVDVNRPSDQLSHRRPRHLGQDLQFGHLARFHEYCRPNHRVFIVLHGTSVSVRHIRVNMMQYLVTTEYYRAIAMPVRICDTGVWPISTESVLADYIDTIP